MPSTPISAFNLFRIQDDDVVYEYFPKIEQAVVVAADYNARDPHCPCYVKTFRIETVEQLCELINENEP